MLRISKLADYGIVVMVALAKRPVLFSNAKEIANYTHISIPMVSKLLKRLTAANLLASLRGVHGGYKLKRDARSISLVDVIHALEDQKGLTECSFGPNECTLQGLCPIESNWRLINQTIETALGSINIAMLTQGLKPEKMKQVTPFGVYSE